MKLKFVKSITKFFKDSGFHQNLKTTLLDLRKRFSDNIYTILFVNLGLVTIQAIYLSLRFAYVSKLIPFWYTKTWGAYQLGERQLLLLIPLISFLLTVCGLIFVIPFRRYYIRYGISVLGFVITAVNTVLTFSLVRLIFISSSPFPPLIKPLYADLILPGILAFVVAYFAIPRFIEFAHDRDIVTNPHLHFHPGMLLKHPAARGGGFLYGILFLVLSIVLVGIPNYLIFFYVAVGLLAILGLLDDYQNTHPKSFFRFLENPVLRLALLFVTVSFVGTLGTKIFSITIPFSGIINFNSYFFSSMVTVFWIVWVLNVLSWSNGIDGQYGGIVGIASLIIAFLALRFDSLTTLQRNVAVLATISAGLSFGFTKYTWHPSKIMWGFGAVCAGLVLSVLSILINSKVTTSVIIILIPFLDAFVTVIRRLFQGKNPLKGDRGHLHHILLSRGWSIRKIAVFYWATTAIFGILGLLSADKYTLQVGFILAGLSAFGIVLLNVRFKKS